MTTKDMSERPAVRFLRLANADGLPLPGYHSVQAAGMDLLAAVKEDVVIDPGRWTLIPTGLAVELPPGFEAQVRPRSGLALRYGIGLVNSPGTIDADYRGEIGVIMINHGPNPFVVKRGERIAQMVIAAVCRAEVSEAARLTDTKRGDGGFGHTG